MDGNVVSVERVIAAPASALFSIVADPSRHPEIDGSGAVVKPKAGSPSSCSLGSTFGMSMKAGVPYSMSNTVIEFEPDHRIAWKTSLSGPLGRYLGGRIWRYEFEPVDGGTLVPESWDISQDKQGRFCGGQAPPAGGRVHDQDAGPPGRAGRVPRPRVTRRSAAIDAAWDERILPTLSEYTRIPCLSPAFDPEWAERGAIGRRRSSCAVGGPRGRG